MKKIKENRGITLIALIITIIVLIILAVVAINAVQGDGIIAHAKNARDSYKTAQEEENTILGNYQIELDNIKNNDLTNEDWIVWYWDDEDEFKMHYFANKEIESSKMKEEFGDDNEYSYEGTTKNVNIQDGYTAFIWSDDYKYSYYEDDNGWEVRVRNINWDKNEYTDIRTTIFDIPVTCTSETFDHCVNLINGPKIPNTIKNIYKLFEGCDNLQSISYDGTIEEFKKLEGYNDSRAIGKIVHCTDGDHTIGTN